MRSFVPVIIGVSIAFLVIGIQYGFEIARSDAQEEDTSQPNPETDVSSQSNALAADTWTPHVQTRELAIDTASNLTQSELENIAIYDARNVGVVNIVAETISYNWFFEPVPRQGSTGSGSIIDEEGYILTNRHVINNATRVFVTFANGQTEEGEVVGVDAENDLAVLKFDPQGKTFTVIPMGSSQALRIGQKVLAIGNPFALDRTLTTGIVSGLGRPVRTDNNLVISDMIQTDTSINPGNSGGPLLDSKGNMIGINTMIYSTSGGSNGVGFAVPVDTAKRVVPDLIRYGYVKRGWIDIEPRQIFPQLVEYASLPVQKGILISRIVSGGNAEQVGLRGGSRRVEYWQTVIYLGGDIIVGIDGTPVSTIANMYEALEDNVPGERIEIEYIRGNTRYQVMLELSERPKNFQWN